MKRAFALFLLFFCPLAPAAFAVVLDPDRIIRQDLLNAGLSALRENAPEASKTGRLVIVDYAKHSREERLYVVNLTTGAVTTYRASHGLGSDPDHDGYLDSFSSVPNSQASPEGAFRVAEEYTGKHGRSVRLDGLDAENQTARDRAIVIHAAAYAEPEHLARYGKLGRSNGCIVFSKDDLARFLDETPEGTLIFVGK
ncbi:MAG: murein L,D-transpeptidase catalytic domain-containing protein [Hyphomonas sp.]